MYFMNNYLTLD